MSRKWFFLWFQVSATSILPLHAYIMPPPCYLIHSSTLPSSSTPQFNPMSSYIILTYNFLIIHLLCFPFLSYKTLFSSPDIFLLLIVPELDDFHLHLPSHQLISNISHFSSSISSSTHPCPIFYNVKEIFPGGFCNTYPFDEN